MKHTRNRGEAAKLEMTPMIDVVFQLLIFFIVTLQPQDILSHLDVSRPSTPTEGTTDPELLEIQIGENGWVLNGRPFTGSAGFEQMERHLARLATYSKNTGIIIKCTQGSPHSALIRTLNTCAREGFGNISVFSY